MNKRTLPAADNLIASLLRIALAQKAHLTALTESRAPSERALRELESRDVVIDKALDWIARGALCELENHQRESIPLPPRSTLG